MSNGRFDILKVGLTEVLADPPGPNHWCMIMDTENSDALTLVTGNPGIAMVLYSAGLEVTAPQLTANVNDWSFTDVGLATIIRISADAPRIVTGVEASGIVAWSKKKTWINVGNHPITFKDQDAGSAAANRFLLQGGGTDITLFPGDALGTYYDITDYKHRSV